MSEQQSVSLCSSFDIFHCRLNCYGKIMGKTLRFIVLLRITVIDELDHYSKPQCFIPTRTNNFASLFSTEWIYVAALHYDCFLKAAGSNLRNVVVSSLYLLRPPIMSHP